MRGEGGRSRGRGAPPDSPFLLTAARPSPQLGGNEVSPSTLFAVASILEGCAFLNGSPQNTLLPGALELACQRRVFVGGDDFKSGQTKVKSVLVDFLIGSGLKVPGPSLDVPGAGGRGGRSHSRPWLVRAPSFAQTRSIVSYNHLGNNDGQNLSAPQQFRSKEVSKSNVVDDMVQSNPVLYGPGEEPDHCVRARGGGRAGAGPGWAAGVRAPAAPLGGHQIRALRG